MNWKIRIKNKNFWLAVVPAFLLLIQAVCVPFGYDFKIDGINDQLLAIVNASFGFLAILGVVNDPTTKGIKDSDLVMSKDKPTNTPVKKEELTDKGFIVKDETGNAKIFLDQKDDLKVTGTIKINDKPFIIQQANNVPDEPVEVKDESEEEA